MNRFLLLLSIIFSIGFLRAEKLKVTLVDPVSSLPVSHAAIDIVYADGFSVSKFSGDDGSADFTLNKGTVTIYITHWNYKRVEYSLFFHKDTSLRFQLSPHVNRLQEVIVTATESKGESSSSIINREAMEHIQPTSFTDLLSLLPGGSTKAPTLNQANFIQLREAGTSDHNYATSSLGTSFIIDGAPISTDANMQYLPQASSANQDYYRNTTNKGVDMRSISTDEIEKVEIIRGIPSVEYGDLTSGVVKIDRKSRATPWEARFKTDGFGKLFYVGKGFSMNAGKTILNVGADYLDAKADPRNNLENYKRITTSVRLTNRWQTAGYFIRWNVNADYTGSIDNDKVDPDLNYMKEDSYRSTYNRIALSNQFRVDFRKIKILESIQWNVNASYQADRIEQTRFIALDRDRPMQTNTEPGEHDGTYLPYSYIANHVVDGKPFNAYAKVKTDMKFETWKIEHKVIAGVEWKMDKNFGEGQQFDLSRPLFVPMPTRPRTYKEIPAGHQLSYFMEDAILWPIAKHKLKVTAGLRGIQPLHLDEKYSMHGKLYLDPRLNAQWIFPDIKTKKAPLIFTLSGGIGMHSKMPTLPQLYPATYYVDVIQLNYWHENPDYRRLNILTYTNDPTNYNLQPARNRKWEFRLSAEYNKHDFSLTYFNEKMNSGFRYSTICAPYTFKKYDPSGIDHENLTTQPDLTTLPYTETSLLDAYSQVTNGSAIHKTGIEFQYSSPRIQKIKTRFTLNGAWFKTTYVNSEPMFYASVTKVVNGIPVNDLYVGYYNWTDGSSREKLSTNLITDTYLEKLGLSFSLTFQLDWYYSQQTLPMNGVPVSYMDNTGTIHAYTDEDREDMYRQWLIIEPNSYEVYDKRTTPFAGYLNLKVTKSITKYAKLAFFIDKLFDYAPNYTLSNGVVVRRNVTPYFGMELNVKI